MNEEDVIINYEGANSQLVNDLIQHRLFSYEAQSAKGKHLEELREKLKKLRSSILS